MNQDLLKEIITRILLSPELQHLLAQSPPEQNPKPGCLIVLSHQDGVRQLSELAERYSQDYSLAICVTGPVELAVSQINRITCEQAICQSHWACLQIPVCTPDQLAQMALGLTTDPTTKLAAWAIACGLPVEIGQIEWGFTVQTPEPYRRLFAGYLQQLAGFGVRLAENTLAASIPAGLVTKPAAQVSSQTQSSVAASFSSLPSAESQPQPAVLPYEKRLLSDKEALKMKGAVQLSKATVLTPGAIDILKQQKVEVYREGVRFL